MSDERWGVSYVDGDGSDEWQLLRNGDRRYFESEAEANAFAEKKRFKGKAFYWQPNVWKEVKRIREWKTEEWVIA